ncbi:MAG TPA: sigma-70 family RNA polymerase sigma factor [Gemmataceae bacterium]
MTSTERPTTSRRGSRAEGLPSYVYHPSFDEPEAPALYDPGGAGPPAEPGERHMPDEATRDHARRMHHAAHRAHEACKASEIRKWLEVYYSLRDRIVLGNRKLTFKAVRSRTAVCGRADDLIGDCQIVLIQAVAAFNPWLGVRFSTYAYTCLLRAMARMARRTAADRLSRSVPLERLPDGGPGSRGGEPGAAKLPRLEEFFRDDHPLLSGREKAILSLRFRLREECAAHTLEGVGRELGLSKERVRQVQAAALGKLRRALQAEARVG